METSSRPGIFGEWVKKRRKALDLTQMALAKNAGCSVFTLRKIESGERRPSRQLAELLAQSLRVSPEEKQTFIRAARGELNLERLQTPAPNLSLPSLAKIQPTSQPGYLPLPPTALVGRDSELAAMKNLFKDPGCCLLTLTGIGGIGKTRLAIEFASTQREEFPGGIYYVPLASVNFPEAIIPAIADALGFVFSGSVDPKEQLLNYISSQLMQPVFLILDNLEHLLSPDAETGNPGAAELVSEFLQCLPNLKVLATSREPLNLRGEWTYELHGLPVPPSGYSGNLNVYSAVSLFVQSARRVRMDFKLKGQEEPAVIRICQLLDGIPLAIELAAAWVGVLSSEEIAQEIDLNIGFLRTSMRDVPERHRSIRASFDHSWQLLSPEERQILNRLSVFRGGFDRAAAAQVAGATLPVLASLVSKSLVRWLENGRYDLHEVIRRFARSHLGMAEQGLETCDRHCTYYLDFVAERESALKSAAQQEAVRELTAEMDNVRTAWIYGIDHEKFDLNGGAVRSLGRYYEATGLLGEGIDQFELLIKASKAGLQDEPKMKALGLALAQQGMLYFRKGEFTRARKVYQESIDILRKIGDQALLTDSLINLGIILHLDGEYERAYQMVYAGLASAQAGNDRWFEAYARYNLGYVDSLLGRYLEGYEQMISGLDVWREIGDPHSIALGLNHLVSTLIRLGRCEEARHYMQESIALCEGSKNRWGLGTAYRNDGLAALAQGDFAQAGVLFRKSLEVFHGFTTGYDIARTLSYLGDATLQAGDLTEAKKIFLNALRSSLDANALPITLDILLGWAQLAIQTGDHDTGFRLSNYVQDNPASPQDTKERAGGLLANQEAKFSDQEQNFIQVKPETITLQELVDDIIKSAG